MMILEEFIILLEQYESNTITPENRTVLFNEMLTGSYDDFLKQRLENTLAANATEGVELSPYRSTDIIHKIIAAEKENRILLPAAPKRRKFHWAIAASLAGIIAFSIYFLTDTEQQPGTAIIADGSMQQESNTTDDPLKITMEDGSIITLEPNSSISYPAHFADNKREVFLRGDAFFEVSKNASRPFFVYNRNIVTHVLGTSFLVKVNKDNHRVEVSVKTGKVEVYANKISSKNSSADNKNNGVILLPNQKVIYNEDGGQFVATLVEKPLPIIEPEYTEQEKEHIVFEETPLKTVLPGLEKNYGIEIIVENENIYNCLFTGDITQQNLYERLDIICQAVSASYEIKGTRILIKGNGCK